MHLKTVIEENKFDVVKGVKKDCIDKVNNYFYLLLKYQIGEKENVKGIVSEKLNLNPFEQELNGIMEELE
jgi:hypothetical protein